MKPLSGRIALVAGATRGAGRGIATALGEAGATVWVTGRSSRAHPRSDRPETIEDTADRVTAAGGLGIPAVVDHTVPEQVAALADRVRAEHGGLDLVVDNVWGCEWAIQFGVPPWELDLTKARAMLENGIWSHVVTTRHLSALLLGRDNPLWIEVTDGDHFGYRSMWFYDVVKMGIIRMAFGLSRELGPKGATALAVTPGFLRSEEMLANFGVTEETWQEAAARDPHFAHSETPMYVGRCVAALAADPNVRRRNGRVFASWDLAREHGIVDVDGRRPHWGDHFAEAFGPVITGDAAYAAWERYPLDPITGKPAW